MFDAKTLDQKFAPNVFDIPEMLQVQRTKQESLVHYKRLQEQLKNDSPTIERENASVAMLFNLTDAMLPKRDIEQEQIEQQALNDMEKFKIITEIVTDACCVSLAQIKMRSRKRNLTIPRYLIMFLARWITDLSLVQIGRALVYGEAMDHSSILHGCARVAGAIQSGDEGIRRPLQRAIIALKEHGVYINTLSAHEQPKWYKTIINKLEN